jgi:Spy/CpxP family protein refolding chaperone
MLNWKSTTILVLAVGLLSASLWDAAADDSKGKAADAKATKTADAKPAAKLDSTKSGDKSAEKSRGRLPAGYGRLDLKDDQKEKIYAIQANYQTRIDELEARLAALKQERDAEIEGVLTEEQKQKLAAADEEKKQKAAERKKSKAEKE